MPLGVEKVFEETEVTFSLLKNIEEIVINWAGVVSEYLAEDSSQVLEEDINALPVSG